MGLLVCVTAGKGAGGDFVVGNYSCISVETPLECRAAVITIGDCQSYDEEPVECLETIEVRMLLSLRDQGRFDLLIDDTAYAYDVGFGGSTGEVHVGPGYHTVSEVGASGTDLSRYAALIYCRDDSGAGSIVAIGVGTSLGVTVEDDNDVVCTIYNTRARHSSRFWPFGDR